MKEIHIRTVACVGVGVIGASYALNFAWKGYSVTLCDVSTLYWTGQKYTSTKA